MSSKAACSLEIWRNKVTKNHAVILFADRSLVHFKVSSDTVSWMSGDFFYDHYEYVGELLDRIADLLKELNDVEQ